MNWTPAQLADYERRGIKPAIVEPTRPEPTLSSDLKFSEPLNIVSSERRIDFWMEFEPPTATSQMKGERVIVPKDYPATRAFVQHYKLKAVEEAEAQIGRHLAPFALKAGFDGPLRLVTEWVWDWRAGEPKKNRAMGWRWKDTQPDFDNISKMLVDQMALLGFFHNDSQIVDARVLKKWGDTPGIRVTLEQLDQP